MSTGKSSRKYRPSHHLTVSPPPADDSAVETYLRLLIHELQGALAVVMTVTGALQQQNAEGDALFALTLERYAGHPLDREIERARSLLAELERIDPA